MRFWISIPPSDRQKVSACDLFVTSEANTLRVSQIELLQTQINKLTEDKAALEKNMEPFQPPKDTE